MNGVKRVGKLAEGSNERVLVAIAIGDAEIDRIRGVAPGVRVAELRRQRTALQEVLRRTEEELKRVEHDIAALSADGPSVSNVNGRPYLDVGTG